jgi:hypothetical protein
VSGVWWATIQAWRSAIASVSEEHIRPELAQMPRAIKGSPNQADDRAVLEDMRWIGKVLLTQEIRRTTESRRLRLPGGYNHWYALHTEFVARVLKDKADAGVPVAPAYAGTDPRHALRYCEDEPGCGSRADLTRKRLGLGAGLSPLRTDFSARHPGQAISWLYSKPWVRKASQVS